MNSAQLHQSFLVKINSLTPGENAINIDTVVVEELLNTAQDILVRKYYKVFDEGEKSKKVLMDLITDYSTSNSTTDSDNYPNGVYIDLAPDNGTNSIMSNLRYILYDSEECFIYNATTNTTSICRVRPLMYKEYIINRNNPFKKSFDEVVIRLEHGNFWHELILPKGYDFRKYRFKYIKNPERIVIQNQNTPEIDDTIHNELLDLSVDLYLKSVAVNSAIKNGNINSQQK